jgi:hypothetical protein
MSGTDFICLDPCPQVNLGVLITIYPVSVFSTLNLFLSSTASSAENLQQRIYNICIFLFLWFAPAFWVVLFPDTTSDMSSFQNSNFCSSYFQFVFQVPGSFLVLFCMPMVFTWHTRPWYVIVIQIGAGICTVYVEAAATIFTSNANIYPLMASFTLTRKINSVNTVAILQLIYGLITFSTNLCKALTNTSIQMQIVG